MYTQTVRDKSFFYRLSLRSQLMVFWLLLVLMAVLPALRIFGDSWWAFVVAGLVLFLLARGSAVVPSRLYADERVLNPHQQSGLYTIVADLSRRAGLRTVPELSLLPRNVINAAATGTASRPRIILTTGLLQTLDARALRGVLAHEIAHIAHRDLESFRLSSLIRTLAVGLSVVGLVLEGMFVGDPLWLLFFLALPVVTLGILFAISRNREYAADLATAEMTDDPEALASALYQIEYRQRSFWSSFFSLPAPREDALFRSHPSTEERINRLLNMGRQVHRAYLH